METTCARPECGKSFLKSVHNQKYCEPECCRLATNKRLIEQYHERKDIMRGGKNGRVCSRKACDTILSRYNTETICESCKLKRFRKRLERWGWDTSDFDE